MRVSTPSTCWSSSLAVRKVKWSRATAMRASAKGTLGTPLPSGGKTTVGFPFDDQLHLPLWLKETQPNLQGGFPFWRVAVPLYAASHSGLRHHSILFPLVPSRFGHCQEELSVHARDQNAFCGLRRLFGLQNQNLCQILRLHPRQSAPRQDPAPQARQIQLHFQSSSSVKGRRDRESGSKQSDTSFFLCGNPHKNAVTWLTLNVNPILGLLPRGKN